MQTMEAPLLLDSPPIAPAKVLIVDDETRIRLALRSCLEVEGYDVEEARDGAEAIRTIIDARPQVVLLDLAMPHLDGMGMLRELRARYHDVMPKVVVLTAWGSPAVEEEAYMLGVSDFVKKPIVPALLRTVVARVLREKSIEESWKDEPDDGNGPFGRLFLG